MQCTVYVMYALSCLCKLYLSLMLVILPVIDPCRNKKGVFIKWRIILSNQLNIPITEMLEILDFEIQQGYKVSWRVVEKFAIKKTFQKWWKSFTEDLNLITKVINDLAQLREFVNNVNEKCMVYKQAWLSTDVITQLQGQK